MRFVILRGSCGWGDRLQCLLQAIWYAKHTRRTLVVDWRDPDFSHDHSVPLKAYLRLEGVKTLELESFLAYWAQHGEELSVAPAAWAPLIGEPTVKARLYEEPYKLPANNGVLAQICAHERGDFAEDVVVFTGTGSRSFCYMDLHHLCLSEEVLAKTRELVAQLGVSRGSYDVVHLRGGSKRWCGGSVEVSDIDETIHSRWPNQKSYLDDVWHRHLKAIEGLGFAPLYVVSDRRELAEGWRLRHGRGELLCSEAGHLIRASGIHLLREEDLAAAAMSKQHLNTEMLRDFAFMTGARTVTGDGVSLFSEMARYANAVGVMYHDVLC